MNIDWHAFTPWTSLAGGLLVGLAAAIFLLANGRIAGISGIVGGLIKPVKGDISWRAAFVLGMVATPTLWALFAPLPALQIDAGYGLLIVAGLLVGVSTRYGSGCTSGHGICGISRLSLRSISATLTFMGTGILTVYIVRHVLGGAA